MASDKTAAMVPISDDLATPILYKNGKAFVGLSWMVIVGAAVLCAIMAVMAIAALLPLRDFSFGRALNSFFLLAGSASFGTMSWGLAVYVRRLSFYHVLLDNGGVEFLFGTKKQPELVRMEWPQINAVHHWRVANEHRYKVTTSDGSYANFTSSTFFGSKKMAGRIAAHAKVSIQED